ncbi:unnamed protein product [Toxocara canis]|uniref:GTD-binding domain-containing protein n=1 Tax=Toxocara canis TaxID=6265 RepID=A0A183UPW3_TOXCA|nr:unnamed protein product [Toxocara canis]
MVAVCSEHVRDVPIQCKMLRSPFVSPGEDRHFEDQSAGCPPCARRAIAEAICAKNDGFGSLAHCANGIAADRSVLLVTSFAVAFICQLYGSAETSSAEARPSLCCEENSVNERIAVLEAKLQAYQVRLRMEIKKKRHCKEKQIVERETHETSENMHLTEIMRLKRERQNLLFKYYVVEQKYYRF